MKFDIKKNKAVVILLSVAVLLIAFICISIFTRTQKDDSQVALIVDKNTAEAILSEEPQQTDDSTVSTNIEDASVNEEIKLQEQQTDSMETPDDEQEPKAMPVPDISEPTPKPVKTPETIKTPDPAEQPEASIQEPEKTSEPMAEPTPTPEPEVITVTISIDAKTAVDAGYSVKKWVLSNTEVEIEAGSTVWDVLNKVARQNGIPVSKTGSGKMLYVQGIGGLFEFDCGDGSGWMYNVNGSYPLVSCGSKEIQNGDDINWRYTCELGNDLGAPMS